MFPGRAASNPYSLSPRSHVFRSLSPCHGGVFRPRRSRTFPCSPSHTPPVPGILAKFGGPSELQLAAWTLLPHAHPPTVSVPLLSASQTRCIAQATTATNSTLCPLARCAPTFLRSRSPQLCAVLPPFFSVAGASPLGPSAVPPVSVAPRCDSLIGLLDGPQGGPRLFSRSRSRQNLIPFFPSLCSGLRPTAPYFPRSVVFSMVRSGPCGHDLSSSVLFFFLALDMSLSARSCRATRFSACAGFVPLGTTLSSSSFYLPAFLARL